MRIEMKPFFRVEQDNFVDYIRKIFYYDNKYEAISKAKEIIENIIEMKECEDSDVVKITDERGQVVKKFTIIFEKGKWKYVEY